MNKNINNSKSLSNIHPLFVEGFKVFQDLNLKWLKIQEVQSLAIVMRNAMSYMMSYFQSLRMNFFKECTHLRRVFLKINKVLILIAFALLKNDIKHEKVFLKVSLERKKFKNRKKLSKIYAKY